MFNRGDEHRYVNTGDWNRALHPFQLLVVGCELHGQPELLGFHARRK